MDMITNIAYAWHEHSRKPKKSQREKALGIVAWLVAASKPKFLLVNVLMYSLGIIFLIVAPPVGIGFIALSLYLTIKAATYR